MKTQNISKARKICLHFLIISMESLTYIFGFPSIFHFNHKERSMSVLNMGLENVLLNIISEKYSLRNILAVIYSMGGACDTISIMTNIFLKSLVLWGISQIL